MTPSNLNIYLYILYICPCKGNFWVRHCMHTHMQVWRHCPSIKLWVKSFLKVLVSQSYQPPPCSLVRKWIVRPTVKGVFSIGYQGQSDLWQTLEGEEFPSSSFSDFCSLCKTEKVSIDHPFQCYFSTLPVILELFSLWIAPNGHHQDF